MRYAVTGANGFVGARRVRALARAGHDVTAFVRKNDEPPSPGERVVSWDVTSEQPPVTALESLDCLVHAAAYKPPAPTDPDTALSCLSVNALGTLNVLRAAETARVAHTVILSAGNVYDPNLP